MIRAHNIVLDATAKQEEYFRRACGTARFAYNWALREWERQYKTGEKPSARKLKAQWNAARKAEFLWSYEITKCAGAQGVLNLGVAYKNFFDDLAKVKRGEIRIKDVRRPTSKKKGKGDSFALWNDQFAIEDKRIRIPNLGWVRLVEPLRFDGKILGAVVKRECHRWVVSVQVKLTDVKVEHPCTGSIVGVDVGVSTLMALSKPLPDDSVKIANPKARTAHMKRQKRLQRRISRQELVRQKTNGKRSNRQAKRQACLRKLHYKVACIRKDALHKATTLVSSNFQTVVLENLNVAGMSKNHNLAGALLDASFGEIRRQFEYKSPAAGGHVFLANRYFPSSKTCSYPGCGYVLPELGQNIRRWTCPKCGIAHDRDLNASHNLEDLVGQALPKPVPDIPESTHGEIAALVRRLPDETAVHEP
jgi:putative transposase